MHSDTALSFMLLWENLHKLSSIFTTGKDDVDMQEACQQNFVGVWLVLNST